MIHDSRRLREVIDEISEWTLEKRRQHLKDIEKAFGAGSAQQLKDALTEKWKAKD